jgi:hypothetical protein
MKKDGNSTPSTGSDDKSETEQENRKTEKKPPKVPNRGRTFDAPGTEKRG